MISSNVSEVIRAVLTFFTKRFRHFKNPSQAKTNQQSVHKNF